MRIGVGFDDTICRTTEIVHDRVEKYAAAENLNPLDIMNDEFLKEGFFNIYLEDIYANAEIKREVKGVLKRLRSRGNEIYIITSRSNNFGWVESAKTISAWRCIPFEKPFILFVGSRPKASVNLLKVS